MRIAQVAPLAEAVPPKLYGGTERVVSWLTEELVRQGHDVTLFASGDSKTSAKLVPCCSEQALRLAGIRDHIASHLVMLNEVRARADQFDIIHFHVDLLQHVLFRDLAHKCLTTLAWPARPARLHAGVPDLPRDAAGLHLRQPTGSDAAAGELARPRSTTDCRRASVPSTRVGGDYLAFLGRIAPEKRPDRAIEIANRAGIPLKIAAKVDPADQAYFDEVIEPLLDHPAGRVHRRDRRERQVRLPRACAWRCCSRSTGPSPLAW